MNLLAELRRRNVFKVGAAYLALAWVVVQATGAIVPALNLPATLVPTVVWIGIIGFPCVLIFSWVYELTPEGLKRESEFDRIRSISHVTGKRLDYVIIVLLVVALGLFLLQYLRPPAPEAPATAEAVATPATSPAVQAEPPVSPQPAAAAAPDDKSIAVLPFVNMSSDKEQEYFSDGISEELLNLLAKIPELKVIARTSSFAFKGTNTPIVEIARQLNVAHVLEGSVRKSGNKIRITAQLVRATDSAHLWSETYDRTLDDIFAVQEEIALVVVAQLRITLLGAAPKPRQTSPEAHALALQARHLANQGTPEGVDRAISLYQQAVVVDPGYASAWDGLAITYLNEAGGLSGRLREDKGFELARVAARRALAADPEYASAHARLGFIALIGDADLAAAAQHYARALELGPTDPAVHWSASRLLAALGRLDEAIAFSEYVTRLDPVGVSGHIRLGAFNLYTRRWDAAVAPLRAALELSPGQRGAPLMLGLAMLGKGEAEAARAAIANETDDGSRLKGTAMVSSTLRQRAPFEQAVAELRERWGETSPLDIAHVYAWHGDADATFAWLDRALAQRQAGLVAQHYLPFYDPVHDDPRWQAFRERTGTSEAQLAAIKFDVKLPQQ